MRIDKFLKVSRLIKRREVAKELCDASLIELNGKIAKPSSEVKEGDVMVLTLGNKKITAKVSSLRPFASKSETSSMVEIIETKHKEA